MLTVGTEVDHCIYRMLTVGTEVDHCIYRMLTVGTEVDPWPLLVAHCMHWRSRVKTSVHTKWHETPFRNCRLCAFLLRCRKQLTSAAWQCAPSLSTTKRQDEAVTYLTCLGNSGCSVLDTFCWVSGRANNIYVFVISNY